MTVRILQGDCREVLRTLPDSSVQCCVTSPPYFGLRDYGVEQQLGLEATPDAYVAELVHVFREVRRVLCDDGTLWLNIGDSYAGSWGAQSRGHETAGRLQGSSMLSARQIKAHPQAATGIGSLKRTPGLKNKDLIGIPWMLAFALRADGWWLRSDIVWHKPNPMPESVLDRPTSAHEHVFLLSKSERYWYDADAIAEGRTSDTDSRTFRGGAYVGGNIDNRTVGKRTVVGNKRVQGGRRNARNVWTIATRPFPGTHFSTFPPELAKRCIQAGSRVVRDTVLDPFGGAGTTGLVADQLGRHAILIELNPEDAARAANRLRTDGRMFADVQVSA